MGIYRKRDESEALKRFWRFAHYIRNVERYSRMCLWGGARRACMTAVRFIDMLAREYGWLTRTDNISAPDLLLELDFTRRVLTRREV